MSNIVNIACRSTKRKEVGYVSTIMRYNPTPVDRCGDMRVHYVTSNQQVFARQRTLVEREIREYYEERDDS